VTERNATGLVSGISSNSEDKAKQGGKVEKNRFQQNPCVSLSVMGGKGQGDPNRSRPISKAIASTLSHWGPNRMDGGEQPCSDKGREKPPRILPGRAESEGTIKEGSSLQAKKTGGLVRKLHA